MPSLAGSHGYRGPITGRGLTSDVGTELTDLGISRWDSDRDANAVMFGDSFSYSWGQDWRSPVILMYDDGGNCLGYPIDNGIGTGGIAPQTIPYQHNNNEFSTILPCDFIRIDGVWYVAMMVTKGLGNELRTVFWASEDLADWTRTDPYLRLNHRTDHSHPGNVMLTFDQIGDFVYIFGTGGLARNKPIYLWRCEADSFPHGYWEPWGEDNLVFAWGNPNEDSPILPGRYGELCFRYIQGNCVLSFFDAGEYKMTALTVPNPTDNWARASRVDYAYGRSFPQLYGGYITPDSKLNEPNGMRFWVSQWNTSNNDPYHVVEFADTLAAQGPLKADEPRPQPEPPPEPEEPPVPQPEPPTPPSTVPTDPQELYELLLKELSASGSTLITTPEGDHLTLREAIEQIFYKQRGLHGLEGRPRHPKTKDDHLGQTLSARAEGLFSQALLVAIADKAGIDTAALYERVKKGIS